MRTINLGLSFILLSGWCAYASEISSGKALEVKAGVGAITSDNDNVGSAPAGKLDIGFQIGDYLKLGIGVSQTGSFTESEAPAQVKDAQANPNAFSAPHHHPIGDDDFIDDSNDPDVVVNIIASPDRLPSRPIDRTELNIWMAEPFLQIGLPVHIRSITLHPFAKCFLGAAGVRDQSGDSNIGLSKGAGVGLDLLLGQVFSIGVEANRRNINTGKESYGENEYLASAGLRF